MEKPPDIASMIERLQLRHRFAGVVLGAATKKQTVAPVLLDGRRTGDLREAIMDWDDVLTLITLGAVLPYASAAAGWWVRKTCRDHDSGAHAPN